MGKHLQIRVVAQTVASDTVATVWPNLFRLLHDFSGAPARPGVLELVDALDEARTFALWSPELKNSLGPGLDKALALKAALEDALFAWDPRTANSLSDQLEDQLDQLDHQTPHSGRSHVTRKSHAE